MNTKNQASSKARPVKASARLRENVTTTKLTGVMTQVNFGRVSVQVNIPALAQIKSNIMQGQKALARAKDRILKPGVKISAKKNVPLFSVDPRKPDVLIRTLNGKTQRGTISSGKFRAIKPKQTTKLAKAA